MVDPLCLSICLRVNAVDNLLLIPNIQFNSLINPTINCGPLSKIILSGSPCNFYTLSLNSLASPSTDIFSVVGMKWTIFVNLSTTTKIELYPWTSSNLVIKPAEIYIQGLSGIELGINLPTGYSILWLGKIAKSLFYFTFFSFLIWTYYTRKGCRKVSHDNVIC